MAKKSVNISAGVENSGDSRITPAMLVAAQQALAAHIARRKKRGQQVKVLKKPYHEGLNNIRCILSIDGERTRLVFVDKDGLWIKSAAS